MFNKLPILRSLNSVKSMNLLLEAQKIKQDIVQFRRNFHMYPELGMEEYRTAGIIEDTLKSLGVETKRIAGTGVIGLLRGKSSGKTIALRADMDALPISDKKKVSYTSKVPGKMHACGHDSHSASLLGAAMLLSKYKNKFNGNIKFLFQPAEETVGGALPMIKEGALKNPEVDAVFGLHVTADIEVGKIGITYGKAYAASDMFDVIIYGESCHGAAPHEGIDAIAVGAQVVSALQNFVSRNVDPLDSAVVTIGMFQGGYERNIIADRVKLSGIIRTLDPNSRKIACDRVKKIILGVTEALGARATINFIPSYPSLINDNSMTDMVKSVAEELLGKDNVMVINKPTMGAEDFSYFLENVNGSFFKVGIKNKEKGIVQPPHSSLFDIDEDALPIAAAMHTQIALKFLAE